MLTLVLNSLTSDDNHTLYWRLEAILQLEIQFHPIHCWNLKHFWVWNISAITHVRLRHATKIELHARRGTGRREVPCGHHAWNSVHLCAQGSAVRMRQCCLLSDSSVSVQPSVCHRKNPWQPSRSPEQNTSEYVRSRYLCVCGKGGGGGGGGARRAAPHLWSNAPAHPCHASPVPHHPRHAAAATRPPAPRRTWARKGSTRFGADCSLLPPAHIPAQPLGCPPACGF